MSATTTNGARRRAPLRVAYARIAQETNALSPVPTTLADFKRTHFLEGPTLARACATRLIGEAPGLVRYAELSGFVRAARAAGPEAVTPVPLFSAWAVPGGPLDRATFEALRDKLARELREAGPLDGLFFSLHGAMGVEGVADPESELLAVAREVLGPRAKVASSFDLHGNLTRRRVEQLDALSAYRTNPHRDHGNTGYRAGRILLDALRGRANPTLAWRTLPVMLGGSPTIDLLAPMRAIFRRMRAMERDPRVLDTSVFTVHPWNSDPELGWSVVAITDGDRALAEQLADELAERCWDVRHAQPPAFPSPTEAIDQARAARLARKFGAVVMADASDVVSAGSTGENTVFLRALLEQAQDMKCLSAVRSPAAVAALWDLPEGERATVTVGGVFDPTRNPPLELSGIVRRRAETGPFGRIAVLECRHLSVVITEAAPIVVRPAFYADAGLDPWRADIIVAKNFFPFRMFFLPLARKTIYVRTGNGLTDWDAAFRLSFAGPLHPRDRVDDWRPTDARRRGLTPPAAVAPASRASSPPRDEQGASPQQ